MKFIYPAVFHKTEEGHYKGYFPDLECCYGEGETLDELKVPMKRHVTGSHWNFPKMNR